MSHQNSGGSGSVGSGNNRLSPNISVNIVHHLHPKVSDLFALLINTQSQLQCLKSTKNVSFCNNASEAS